jgi:hypothetical protein
VKDAAMFMIDTPQTVTLYGLKPEDGKPAEPAGSITFQHETEDVSKCQMIVAIEDRTYTFTFGSRGPLVETAYEDDATRKAKEEAEKKQLEEMKRHQEAERENARKANAGELKTADDTTAKDVANDAPKQREIA